LSKLCVIKRFRIFDRHNDCATATTTAAANHLLLDAEFSWCIGGQIARGSTDGADDWIAFACPHLGEGLVRVHSILSMSVW
jgi:hypothetical protein